MKTLPLIFAMLLLSIDSYAQCECTDCSIDIVDNTTVSSFMEINGATNDELGVGGQALCMVCLNLTQDAMEELDINLIAPDGSSVALTTNNVIGFGEEIFFEICFVPCSQSADPDSGFSDVFDTSNPWQDFTTYDGTYYPSSGCLEDLTGDVNGEWELEITDVFFLEDGELFDWYLVFSDDSGLGCGNSSECSEVICSAEGGELNQSSIELCEGDPGLNIDIDPNYPNNNEPPMPEFDYSWVIVDADTDVIEDISADSDLTTYPSGNYLICGLSFLSDDAPEIPSPDGSLTVDDIEDGIDDEDYCADLSDDCMEVTIGDLVVAPDIDGPDEACIGELVTYTIEDYDSDITYLVSFTGAVSFFSGSDDTYEIAWDAGPAEICFIIESACGDVETCIEVDLIGSPDELEIIGNLEPCPGSTEVYTFEPVPSTGEMYQVVVTGGTIINTIGNNAVEIEWPDVESTEEICIELIGAACLAVELCEEIEIELDYEIPDELDTPPTLCENEIGVSEINSDSDILDYIWTVTNLDLISGQNTESIEYTSLNPGTATVCLEVITACGMQGPICEELEILEIPDPMIEAVAPSCDFTFTLVSNANPDNVIEWTLENGAGNADIENDSDPTTEVTVDEPGIYIFQIEETNGMCSEIEEVTVEILDELTLSDFTFECNLSNEYTVSFSILNGESPYFINGDALSDNTFTSSLIDSEEDFEFVVTDNIGCSAIAVDEFTCPCISDAGSMNGDEIKLCVAEDILFDADYENDGEFDNNDVGAYFIHDNNDDELGEIFESNLNGAFEYDDNIYELGVTYYISYVVGTNDGNGFPDLDDDCLSVSIGQPVIFFDLPQASLIFDEETCSNEIIISGTLDEETTIEWNQSSGPGNAFFSDDESLPVTIEVSSQGSYSFEVELKNEVCVNFIDIDIEFIVPPLITSISEDCNSSADFYTISFDVSGGLPPFMSSIPGSFDQNTFTSESIPTGEDYQVFVTDANGCASSIISGSKLCDCISTAGFMSSDVLVVCVDNDSISVQPVVGSLLDGDDLGLYYLHTSSTNNLGDIISTSLDGTFFYNQNIVLDSIYYVSFVVGNNNNGAIDFSDPCLDISSGQPVLWNSIPNVNAGPDQTTCEDGITLNAMPTNGEWELISYPISLSNPPQIGNNANAIFDLEDSGIYTLAWKASNGLCTNSDTIILTKNASPNVTDIQTVCSQDLLTYDVSFDIDDNNVPFMVNGEISGSNFVETDVDVSVVQVYTIANGVGCTSEITIGPISCECQSEAGTLNNALQNLCSFDSIDVSVSNNDYFIEEGDTLAFVIHDGDEFTLGNIISISYGANIPYSNDLEFNTTYYLSVVIANIENGEIDLSDICLQFSNGAEIIFTEEVNVSIDDQLEGCIGDVVTFNVTSNIYPIDIVLESSLGGEIMRTISSVNDLVDIEIESDFETWTIQTINTECANSLSGEIIITGQTPTTFELIDGFEICNNALFGSTVNTNDLFVNPMPEGEWTLNGVSLVNGVLDFEGLAPDEYELVFTNVSFDNLCEGSSDQISFTVIECICPIFDNPDLTICNDNPNLSLSSFDTANLDGFWTIENPNDPSNLISIVNNELIFESTNEGNYIVTFNIDDPDYPSECDPSTSFMLEVESGLQSGRQEVFPIYCSDEMAPVDLHDLLIDEDLEGTWILDGTALNSSIIDVDGLSIGDNVLTYNHVNGGVCDSQSTEVLLIVESPPIVTVMATDVLCFGYDDGEIQIVIENPNGDIVECYVNEIIQTDGKAISNLSPGIYNVYVRRGQCESESVQIVIDEPAPLIVALGDDIEIEIDEEVRIQAIVNILESDIDGITWSDLSGILGVSELELVSVFQNDNIINIEIIDENGCIANDEINIRVIEPVILLEDIYVPNIFAPDVSDVNNGFSIFNTEQITLVNKFQIYDRWGNKVYSKENIDINNQELKWDGYFNNEPSIQGVYVYMIEVTFIDGKSKILSGDITLIR